MTGQCIGFPLTLTEKVTPFLCLQVCDVLDKPRLAVPIILYLPIDGVESFCKMFSAKRVVFVMVPRKLCASRDPSNNASIACKRKGDFVAFPPSCDWADVTKLHKRATSSLG